MVKGCFTNAGQFQVVIGTNVGDYYQALIASTGQAQVDKEQVKKAARQNMKWHEQLISHFAEIFFPLLPALISGGLILGFRNVIGDLPMSNGQTLAQMYPSLQTIYDFLWLIGEAIFFYLPVGICWSAVKKMGGTPILGIVLGVTLVSPQLMNAYLLGQQLPEVWDFGMFSIAKVGYQAQVIPALLAGLALGVIETRLKRIVPDYLYLVVVPVCSLILAVNRGLRLDPCTRGATQIADPRGVPRPCADWSVWSHDWRWRCLCGTSPDDRQLCSDWCGIVWLPVRAAGDHRRTPDHPCY